MTAIYFGKTGRDKNRAERQAQFPVVVLVEKLGQFATRYIAGPPLIDPDTPTREYGDPSFCVAFVDADEVCERFPKEGYYWFTDLTPQQCVVLLGLSER